MYQDAKEELKRLEEALLEDAPQQEETDSQWNIDEEALSDIPDLPESDHRDKLIFWLTAIIIVLAAGIVGMVAFWLVRYGGAFL